MDDDRRTRLQAAYVLAKLLGTTEGCQAIETTGWREGQTIIVTLTADRPDEVRRRVDRQKPPVTMAVYDRMAKTITFRSSGQAVLEAQLREDIAQVDCGRTVSLTDFSDDYYEAAIAPLAAEEAAVLRERMRSGPAARWPPRS